MVVPWRCTFRTSILVLIPVLVIMDDNDSDDYSGSDIDVRVVGISSASDGYVELVNEGTWGKVCADGWDIEDASVICRQLYNTTASRAYSIEYGDSGPNSVLTSNVQCTGRESRFSECVHGPWESTCPSNAVAALECEGATKIRLANGNTPLEGRVELFYNGEWGTICDDGWDYFDAVVACRHLGNYAVKSSSSAKCCGAYGAGTGTIHLDNLGCTGTEARIEDCIHSGWGSHNCGHHEDSGVTCTDIRINNGNTTEWIGLVETLHNGQWGNICLEDFDDMAAKVFCYQLHMTEAALVFGKPQDLPVFMQGLKCHGNETMLANCSVATWGNYTCSSGSVASIKCRESGNVRLRGGVNEGEGRVEIFYGGSWGTICDDDFAIEEAEVVCRQLGFVGANADTPVRKFGQGTGQIHLDNLACTGAENRLDECRHPNWGDHNCGHHEDAGVVCDTSDCREPLGMENGNIGDLRISASGYLSLQFAPSKARLNLDTGSTRGVAWIPQSFTNSQWIKVDLRVPHLVTGVMTQGRNRTGEYVTQYTVKYSNDGILWTNIWRSRSENIMNFIANTDDNTIVTNYFEEAVTARFIMIVPALWNLQIALRFELLGCGECYNMLDASDYRGSKSTTALGKTCQKWTSQLPHRHTRTSENYPDSGLGDHNFCRNPDGEITAWCYTTDPTSRFELCDIGLPGEYCGNEALVVRLADGNTELEGRVEVFHNGAWGTVCDDSFGPSDAKVVCRMLGYEGTESQCCKKFGPGSGVIVIDDLACLGTEDSLEQCRHNGWGKHNCRHDEDIGVICKRPVRLTGGPSELIGRVEIFHDLEWGTICNEGFDKFDGRVICSMLGGYNYKRMPSLSEITGKSTGPIHVTNMDCNGTEGTLDECNHDEWGVTTCGHADDALLECERGLPVRLVGGPSKLEGRVEIFHSGQWGTVCDDGWDYDDVAVVCKQLGGFLPKTSKAARCCAAYGPGVGSILLDGVQCSGSEATLHDCAHLGWTTHNCNHNEDAGAMCTDTRLRNNDDIESMTGIVDVLRNGEWSGVCSTGFNMAAAHVVCSQLFNTTARSFSAVPMENYPTTIRNVSCTGTETALMKCSYVSGSCETDMIVKVVCAEVRLVDGPANELGGRVEILDGGRWGAICGNGWNMEAAKVTCREAGFCSAKNAFKGFFPGTTAFVWSTIKCTGTEAKLRDCNRRLGPSPCTGTFEEAGVTCRRSCLYPGDICNGVVQPSKEEYGLGDVLNFTCNDGFELIGTKTLTCTGECEWDAALPKCQIIICHHPPAFAFAKVHSVAPTLPISTVVFYDCEEGYEDVSRMRGYMICSLGGRWEGQPPSCQPIKKDEPSTTPKVKTSPKATKNPEINRGDTAARTGKNEDSNTNSAVIVGLTVFIVILILFILIVAAIVLIRKKNERNRIPRAFTNKNPDVGVPDINHDKDDTPFCNYEFQNNDESDRSVLGGL
ncbi:deleted in malignant brain tumors 1 protein-like [Anneissia japonica]|uniref:deleted in malignant brain tumors 1 protein-like n=1 Tax=Anneissia japonica TaxID=1529436 RepID=UPI001425A59D|nr:deleted in malignant brain tumors 1 protein-like [Anneissia japonica]